ncbi:MAG TPA: 50S ribosomal protein L11 methyltransferase [Peptococcaceae bacterium]|nr:MAG: Ribosomal protein L11 methyltransferase [Moorella sp. 60_41]HBT46512.1 50S ribosomal protein L11 methyltransferase [Peptococcaceae bacterium]
MKWQEISVTTPLEAGEAVAGLFYEAGAQGLVVEDKDGRVVLRGYLPRDETLKARLRDLQEGLKAIGRFFPGCRAELSSRSLEEEDWASAWKAYFKPLKIGRHLVVKPSWEEYSPLPGELVMELDPGMAFGTGTHPTTSMALEMLEDLIEPGDVVYDVGTGSGILAIACALLGARTVIAVDNDSVAVRTARENVKRNGLEGKVKVRKGDLLQGFPAGAHVVTANIVADVLLALLPQAAGVLLPNGRLLLGGIIAPRAPELVAALGNHGFTVTEEKRRGDWVALAAMKTKG